MTARETTPVMGAAKALLTARCELPAVVALEAADVLADAGLLIDPEAAEALLEDCRAQAATEVHAQIADLETQLAGARSVLTLASAESYPGELEHLRGLLRALCRLPETPALRDLLVDHYSDCRMVDATLAEAGEVA
jgi:hypothetical protein